jgi:hypothetical protein
VIRSSRVVGDQQPFGLVSQGLGEVGEYLDRPFVSAVKLVTEECGKEIFTTHLFFVN